MRIKAMVLGAAIGAMAGVPAVVRPRRPQDTIYVPLLTYRTGPFAGSGIPIANGMHDYLDMLNERDGGIGGVKIVDRGMRDRLRHQEGRRVLRVDQGQEPGRHQSVFDRHHAAADPEGRGRQDPGPVHGLRPFGFGRRQDLPVDLQPAGHLLGRRLGVHQATSARRKAGSTSSRARRSASSISTRPTARSRSRCSSSWRKEYGFELKLYPVPAQDMQNQSSLWLNVRRDQPDWIYLQGWGAMNPTAVKEAAKVGFPMNRLVGVWWAGGDDDARPAGAEAKGYNSLDFHAVGTNFPGDPGHPEARRRQGNEQDPEGQGRREPLQPRRLQLDADRRGDPQRAEDHRQEGVTGEDVRRGLETLNITDARLKETRLGRLCVAGEGLLQRPQRPPQGLRCRSGTARSG